MWAERIDADAMINDHRFASMTTTTITACLFAIIYISSNPTSTLHSVLPIRLAAVNMRCANMTVGWHQYLAGDIRLLNAGSIMWSVLVGEGWSASTCSSILELFFISANDAVSFMWEVIWITNEFRRHNDRSESNTERLNLNAFGNWFGGGCPNGFALIQ